MLDYLDLPIYDCELIYSYLKHQLAHETYGKHVEKFKSTLDFIKNPCYNGKYFDTQPYISRFKNNLICTKFYLYQVAFDSWCYYKSQSFKTRWKFNKGKRNGYLHFNRGYMVKLYRSATKMYVHLDKLKINDSGMF